MGCKTRKDTFQILYTGLFCYKIVTNLKSRNNNRATAPEILHAADSS